MMSKGFRGAEGVAVRLERAIQSGKFKAGERVPSERDLAARWKLSRTVVREGLAMLVSRGTLSRKHGSGTYVNAPELQRGMEVWREMASRHEDIQADLIEFRQMLECRSAELAAKRHDAADRRRLELAGAEVEAAWSGVDREQQLRTDAALHHAIADATHNPVFAVLMRSLHQVLLEHMHVTHAGTQLQSEVTRDVQAQHRNLVSAILARDPVAARAAAATHLQYVRVRLNFLPPSTV